MAATGGLHRNFTRDEQLTTRFFRQLRGTALAEQGGWSALGSEAHKLSDQTKRLSIPAPANFACEDTRTVVVVRVASAEGQLRAYSFQRQRWLRRRARQQRAGASPRESEGTRVRHRNKGCSHGVFAQGKAVP